MLMQSEAFQNSRGRGGGFERQNNDNQNEFPSGGFRGRGRGGFGQPMNDEPSRGGFDESNNFGGRGGLGHGRGGFGGGRGRGGFQPTNDTNPDNNAFPSRGGRGHFDQPESARGGLNESNDFGGRGGLGRGRGGFGGRGEYIPEGFSGGGRGRGGGFGQQKKDENQDNNEFPPRGGFDGNRGSFDQPGPSRGGRGGGFHGNSQTDRNDFGYETRGGFNGRQNNDNQNEFPSGGIRGGGRGRGFGQQMNDANQNNNVFQPRGGGRGTNRDGPARGGFDDNNGFGDRGGRGRGRFNDGRGNGPVRGGRRGYDNLPRFETVSIGGVNRGGQEERDYFNDGNNQGAGLRNINPDPVEEDERRPYPYIPTSRGADELFAEDRRSSPFYETVGEHDQKVDVTKITTTWLTLKTWTEAELEEQLHQNITMRACYVKPRNVQATSIPLIFDGFDVKCHAETGSGKTAAYLIPIIDQCMKDKKVSGPFHFKSELASPYAVIITPARELAHQVYEQAVKFAAGTNVTVAKAYGQYNVGENLREICAGCDILVGTPGRLKDFIQNGQVLVKLVRILVLDEADRLSDPPFYRDVLDIVNVKGFPDKEARQTLLFSATFPDNVVLMADRLMDNPVYVTNHHNLPNKKINEAFVIATAQTKLEKMVELLSAEKEAASGGQIRRTLVFVNSKHMSDMAALFLCQRKILASSINSDRPQHLREHALMKLRNHQIDVLVATDVCARGIDVKELDHVINVDLPQNAISYIHRIGRTGRIAPGFATTFIEGHEPLLNEIVAMMNENGEPIPEILKNAVARNVVPLPHPPHGEAGDAAP